MSIINKILRIAKLYVTQPISSLVCMFTMVINFGIKDVLERFLSKKYSMDDKIYLSYNL